MSSIEGILYPALILAAGVVLGLVLNALEERWDDWQDRRRKEKDGF